MVEEICDQLAAVAVAQRFEQDRGRVELAAAPAPTFVEQLGAPDTEKQRRGIAREVRDVLDEIEKRGLAPVDVVENDDERLSPRDRLEKLPQCPKGVLVPAGPTERDATLSSTARAAEAERLGHALGDELGLRLTFDLGRDRLDPLPVVSVGASANSVAHDLGDRPVGDALTVREAAAPEDSHVRAEPADELLHEPRLAHACGAEHREQVTGSICD